MHRPELAATERFQFDQMADDLGLHFVERSSFFRVHACARLEGKRKGLSVLVDLEQTPEYITEHRVVGLDRRVLTHYQASARVTVSYKFGAGPRMQLLREGTFRSWLKQFGYQDIEIGNAELDFQLTIKGQPEDEIKKILLDNLGLVRRHCQERVATLPQSDGSTITAQGVLSTNDRDKGVAGLSSLIDVLVSLASTDLIGAHALASLPGAREQWTDKGVWWVQLEGPIPVRLNAKRVGSRFVTRACIRNPDEVAVGSFLGSEGEAIARHVGNPRLSDAFSTLQDTTVEIGSTDIELCWPSVVQEHEPLLRGARVLTLLASPQQAGAYR